MIKAVEIAKEIGKDGIVVVNLSGRGDKDVRSVMDYLGWKHEDL